MYAPPYYRWSDRAAALAFAADYNFATLITVVGGAPTVSHLPFLIDVERNVLRGHLARANPHSGALGEAAHLAVFTGPNAYISPDWYGEASKDVPTWNYVVVHVAGRGRVIDEARAVDRFLVDLSDHEEGRRPDLDRGGKIWTLDKVPPKDHARMRAAIVAFEIDIASVEAKAKLNQNKKLNAVAGVIAALSASGSQVSEAVARLMREFNPKS
ncbi:MAG: FMN-binding negative transcriptional regulator [Parvularculaceae bacterium]